MMTSRFNAWAVAFAAVALLGAGACSRTEQPAQRQAADQPADGQPDTVISTNVQARYYADQTLRGREIDVSTTNGVVTLRGAVDSEHSRNQAIQIARQVTGVRDVRDELRIDARVAEQRPDTTGAPAPTSATQEGRTELGTAQQQAREGDTRNPGWITTKIQARYFVTPDVRPWKVDVSTTSDGVVTLSGEVENADGRRKAVEIAQSTEGVTRVEDQLRIRADAAATAGRDDRPAGAATRDEEARRDTGAAAEGDMREGGPLGDTWLTTKVQSKFFLDDEVKGREIDVSTMNGVVTLTGTVRSESEKRQAVAIARNTDGVRQVNDQLRIDQTPTGTAGVKGDPGATPGRTDWDVQSVQNPFGDEWVTTKIQSKFYLEDSVKGAQIDVSTREGVVTLRGTVPSAEAKQAAEQIARGTAGVQRVESQLQVSGQTQR
jgi:osmotically-inducible protein OsmY